MSIFKDEGNQIWKIFEIQMGFETTKWVINERENIVLIKKALSKTRSCSGDVEQK